MENYKKRSFAFRGEEEARLCRAGRRSEDRKSLRSSMLSKLRAINMSILYPVDESQCGETKDSVGGPKTSEVKNSNGSKIPTPLQPSRREQLNKWKAERELKKQLEAAKKNKPLFKVGHVAYKPPPSFSNASLNPSSKLPKQEKKIPGRIAKSAEKGSISQCTSVQFAKDQIKSSKTVKSTTSKDLKLCKGSKLQSFAPKDFKFTAPSKIKNFTSSFNNTRISQPSKMGVSNKFPANRCQSGQKYSKTVQEKSESSQKCLRNNNEFQLDRTNVQSIIPKKNAHKETISENFPSSKMVRRSSCSVPNLETIDETAAAESLNFVQTRNMRSKMQERNINTPSVQNDSKRAKLATNIKDNLKLDSFKIPKIPKPLEKSNFVKQVKNPVAKSSGLQTPPTLPHLGKLKLFQHSVSPTCLENKKQTLSPFIDPSKKISEVKSLKENSFCNNSEETEESKIMDEFKEFNITKRITRSSKTKPMEICGPEAENKKERSTLRDINDQFSGDLHKLLVNRSLGNPKKFCPESNKIEDKENAFEVRRSPRLTTLSSSSGLGSPKCLQKDIETSQDISSVGDDAFRSPQPLLTNCFSSLSIASPLNKENLNRISLLGSPVRSLRRVPRSSLRNNLISFSP